MSASAYERRLNMDSVVTAAAKRMEEDEREIASLRRQKEAMGERIALLQAEKNEIELRLSLQILKIHDGYLNRVTECERRLTELEGHMDRIANHAMGLPQREEFERVKSDVSYLMANTQV